MVSGFHWPGRQHHFYSFNVLKFPLCMRQIREKKRSFYTLFNMGTCSFFSSSQPQFLAIMQCKQWSSLVSARPSKPVIYSEDGDKIVSRTRPVMLGGSVKLYCSSESGDPPPSLTWRRAGVPLPAAGQSVDSGAVTSSVMIEQVTTSDQGSTISCTAHNSLLIQPQTTSVKLEIIGEKLFFFMYFGWQKLLIFWK